MDEVSAARALALVQAVLDDVRQGDAADVLTGLAVLRQLRTEISAWEPELITAAREQGASWARIAPALGVTSRQAAERRYLRLRPSVGGETTGEARVRAARDKRAGDRAVADWARANTVSLRRLAGRVSASAELGADAQTRVDDALAADDPAALLSPLADVRAELGEAHAALANEIDTMTRRSGQVRQATQGRRDR